MSCIELWYDSDDSDEGEPGFIVRLERRRLRDCSNPLELPSETFTKYFRVSKDLFKYLLDIVDAKLGVTVGSASLLPIIKLSAAIRFFAEGSYQKGVGNDLFVGIAQPTMSKALTDVIDIIETEVCPSAIKFPTQEAEKNAIKLGFFEKTGFPGVIGCVDGTHVKIITPRSDIQHLYYNRKGFHSLNVMIVCDHQLAVRYVDANHPGSSHDSFIWNISPLDEFLNTSYRNGDRNTWLLGDAGYPLKPYLITPFRSTTNTPTSRMRAKFNTMHSKTRITVERTIGLWKNIFRCVLGARQLHYKPEKATKIVNVCCALHNLRIKFNMSINDEDFQIDEEEFPGEIYDDEDEETANNIRETLMYSIL